MLDHLPEKIDLEGANNFRDMGGYPTAFGSMTRRGLLYRSDHLGNLTEADQQLIAQLGIKTVVDLRRQEERDEILDNIVDPAINQVWLPVAAEGSDVQKMRRGLEEGRIDDAGAYQHLVEANQQFVQVFSHVYSDFLHLLLDPANYPLVFHCTAGKDRAGYAAALSLLTVGVSQDVVFHDYLATNHCTANYVNGILDGLSDLPEMKASPEAIRTLMQVQPAFLQTAVDTYHQDYGSLDNYLLKALGINEAKRSTLRDILLEPQG